MTALVTGGAGFIGGHLVDALEAAGEETHIIDRHGSQGDRYINPAATLHCIDIADPKVALVVSEVQPSIVYHLAAQISVPRSGEHPIEDATSNIIGSLNILEAARRCNPIPKFVFVSTGGAIYGEVWNSRYATEDIECNPISPYGASKLAVESYLRVYSNLCGLRYGIVRPGNVYGPRQTARGGAGVVAIFAKAMLANEPITIYGDGSAFRDYVFVDDIVQGILEVAASDMTRPFNIASGTATSVNEVFETIRKHVPYSLSPMYKPERSSDVAGIVLDIIQAKRELGWAPKTPFEEGIAMTVDALKASSQ